MLSDRVWIWWHADTCDTLALWLPEMGTESLIIMFVQHRAVASTFEVVRLVGMAKLGLVSYPAAPPTRVISRERGSGIIEAFLGPFTPKWGIRADQ